MKTNFQAAAAISAVQWTATEHAQIAAFLETLRGDTRAQQQFFAYCQQWKLAPWIATQLQRHGLLDAFSDQIRDAFSVAHATIAEQNERRNAAAKAIFQAFNEQGIDVAILKGNLLAHTVYEDPGYKRMNDFDILIHKEDWDRIQDVYASLGYIPLGFGWNGEKEKPASFSHVGMSFISPDFSCIVGSQWGLKSPTTHFTVHIEEAWATALPFDFFGVPVKQLSTPFNLLHLVLHMGVFKCGIRDCMDVYNLVQAKPFDEAYFIDLVNRSNAREKTFFTFTISNLCVPVIPEHLLAQVQPQGNGFLLRRLRKRLATHRETGDFQSSYNDYFQDIEKVVIYFNLFPKFHTKLVFYGKIISMIYFPEMSMALKLNDSSAKPTVWNKIIARLKAPYFVFALIAQEIGWKFTFLLFIKLFVDVIVSLKNYFIRKDSYFDLLRKRGVDPKNIEKAVKNIQ